MDSTALSDQQPLEDGATAWLRAAALEEKKALDEVRTTLLSEHSHMFRWLSASLLALNGGGAVALLSSEKTDAGFFVWAGIAFLLGITAALLIAVSAQRTSQLAMPKVQMMIGYWLAVSIDAERDEVLEKEITGELLVAHNSGKWSRVYGWLSALSFLAGAIVTGVSAIGVPMDEGLADSLIEQANSR